MPTLAGARQSTQARHPGSEWKTRLVGVPGRMLTHGLLSMWCLISMLGLLWVVASSLKTNQELFRIDRLWRLPAVPQWQNYVRAWTRSRMGNYFFNSVVVTAVSVLGADIVGAMAAYILARFRFKGNSAVLTAFILGSAVPLQLIVVPLYVLYHRIGLLDTIPGLVFALVATSLPFTVFVLTGFFKTLPTELEEAAVLDGASEWQVFWRVMLPLAAPGMITVTIFNSLRFWNEYLLPMMLINSTERMTMPVGLFNLMQQSEQVGDQTGLLAGFVIVLVPTLVIFFILQGRITKGMTAGALKG